MVEWTAVCMDRSMPRQAHLKDEPRVHDVCDAYVPQQRQQAKPLRQKKQTRIRTESGSLHTLACRTFDQQTASGWVTDLSQVLIYHRASRGVADNIVVLEEDV